LFFLCLAVCCQTGAANSLAARYTYEVVEAYHHDPQAFTQGLVWHEGRLYEGTGLYGSSSLRQVDLETGEVLQSVSLPPEYFGEGIAVLGSRVYQLTWREKTGFVYDLESFAPLGSFSYPTEGWGLTTDGQHLIMSDGSHILYFLDPEDFEVVHELEVRDGNDVIPRLNELEYIAGEIYANVWLTDSVVRIDPRDGQVTGWIDFTGLLSAELAQEGPVDVLNGIAYDGEAGRLFVTGKLWPRLYHVRLKELQTDGL
jgi:glutamine cyclotransferase